MLSDDELKEWETPDNTSYTENYMGVELINDSDYIEGHHDIKSEGSADKRYSILENFERDPLFFINDIRLAIKRLNFITQKHMSMILNESSASGKTSFIDVFIGIIQYDINKIYLNILECEDTKNEIKEVCETVVPISLNFSGIYKRVWNSDELEQEFIRRIIQNIISQAKSRIQLTHLQESLVDCYSDDVQRLENQSTHNLVRIHNDLMFYLIDEVRNERLCKKSVYQENERTDPKKITKIIFIIDEINVFELKNIRSQLLNNNTQHRNWYIKMMEGAISPDRDHLGRRCYSFILTPILPISTEREQGYQRIRFTYFSQFLSTFEEKDRTSFGEVTYDFYNKIAVAESENKLKTFLQQIRTKKNILEDYLDANVGNEKEDIKKVWIHFFPEILYEGDKMKSGITQQELINRSFSFFKLLWGQMVYKLKFNNNLLKRVLKHNLSARANNKKEYSIYKINTGYFMHFLMNKTTKNSISIKQENNVSSEKSMESFWEGYTNFEERYNAAGNYGISLSDEHATSLCNQSESIKHNCFEKTIQGSTI